MNPKPFSLLNHLTVPRVAILVVVLLVSYPASLSARCSGCSANIDAETYNRRPHRGTDQDPGSGGEATVKRVDCARDRADPSSLPDRVVGVERRQDDRHDRRLRWLTI